MTTTREVKNEILNFIRSGDILTDSIRGVQEKTITGTLSSDTELLINVSNVKNIVEIIVDSVELSYGKDYTLDLTYDDSGTKKAKISFTSSQTGSYSVTYHYGTDKIYGSFPKDDLSIGSYPRIGFDVLAKSKDNNGIGGETWVSDYLVSIVLAARRKEDVEDYMDALETLIDQNNKSFSFASIATVVGQGPMGYASRLNNEVFQRSLDVRFQLSFTNK